MQWAAVCMSPAGLVAVIAGWITTEVGRQPYTVYGVLRTSESAAPLHAATVGTTLIAFVLVYFAVFGAGVFYMLRLMAVPPHSGEPGIARSADGPVRAAGITPAASVHQRSIPRGEGDGR